MVWHDTSFVRVLRNHVKVIVRRDDIRIDKSSSTYVFALIGKESFGSFGVHHDHLESRNFIVVNLVHLFKELVNKKLFKRFDLFHRATIHEHDDFFRRSLVSVNVIVQYIKCRFARSHILVLIRIVLQSFGVNGSKGRVNGATSSKHVLSPIQLGIINSNEHNIIDSFSHFGDP